MRRLSRLYALAGSMWLMLAAHALALGVETPLPDEAQEARAKALFHQIRCVVCQGESVADSPAGIAADIRSLIRSEIANGVSNETIKSELVMHYGDEILMKPPLVPATWPLWYGPFVLLGLAFLLAARFFRRAGKRRP